MVKMTLKTVSSVLLRYYFVVGFLKLRKGKSEIVFSLVGGLLRSFEAGICFRK